MSCVVAAGIAVCKVSVFNSGNVRLADVRIYGDTNDCNITLLEPQTSVYCNMSRELHQDDFDAAAVTLMATGASAMPRGPVGTLPSIQPDEALVTLNRTGALDLSATTSPHFVSAAGEAVTLTFKAGNIGSATLHDISLALSAGLSAINCSTSGGGEPGVVTVASDEVQLSRLGVDGVMTCSGVLNFTQDMLEAGDHVFKVNGSADWAAGNSTATAVSQNVVIRPSIRPGLAVGIPEELCKLPDSANSSVNCTVWIQNTGNVRLQNVSIASISGCGVELLQPSVRHECQLLRVLTQSDFDEADASGTDVQLTVVAEATPLGPNTTVLSVSANQPISLQSKLTRAAGIISGVNGPVQVHHAGECVVMICGCPVYGQVAVTRHWSLLSALLG